MKKIIVVGNPRTVFGRPFTVPDFESEPGQNGPQQIEDESLGDILKALVVGGIPRQKLVMNDSIQACDLLDAIRDIADDRLLLSQGSYTWIKKVVDDYAPAMFGVNAKFIHDALENIEKAHEAKKE